MRSNQTSGGRRQHLKSACYSCCASAGQSGIKSNSIVKTKSYEIKNTPSAGSIYTEMMQKSKRRNSISPLTSSRQNPMAFLAIGCLVILMPLLVVGPKSQLVVEAINGSEQQQHSAAIQRSTQPTIERQVNAPNAPANVLAQAQQVVTSQPAKPVVDNKAEPLAAGGKPMKPKQTASSLKKSSLAAQQNYDKYQLKATNSYNSQSSSAPASVDPQQQVATLTAANGVADSINKSDDSKAASSASALPSAPNVVHKKSSILTGSSSNKPLKQSSFSLLKKFFPSFMTSAGPMAAAAAAAASAVVDKQQHASGQHSRSSQSVGEGLVSRASGKIINLLTQSKKASGAVPDHAPYFIRKPNIDRQAGFASGLLSNPLSLGLLFSAPLIPSLLLTPLAIAGLSPAMSAINNFFGDDEEASTPASAGGPLSAMLSGSSSPLSSLLQASGAGGSQGSSGESSPSFALQAMQSILGQPSTTEKPLFNPGLFASQSIQNAAAALSGGSSSSGSSGGLGGSSGISQASSSPIRNFFSGGGGGGSGGGSGSFLQSAASMIAPSFVAPPSSSSGSSSGASSLADADSDSPGFMQVASDVFDKVASYMGSGDSQNSNKDLAQASSSPAGSVASQGQSPLSTLVGLSNFSPFQLSSLLASGPLGSAMGSGSGSGAGTGGSGSSQRVGFFSTLRNVYELFSSSFLRRNQEVDDTHECKQRLICELHQRAMNSKLFKRSLQSNLMELANLDRNLQEQIKSNPIQARVDADTKAMLNDFLKATNNFRAGRELVNCSKMYPKCSKSMLISTANAYLADPENGRAFGKFSNLMKKMKFKSSQQHQSQWKLRKANKSSSPSALQIPMPNAGAVAGVMQPSQQQQQQQYQPTDYLQVAPMNPIPNATGSKAQQVGQLTPADSLKFVQQIMLMSQQQQQQPSQYASSMQIPSNVQYRQQQPTANGQQYSQAPVASYAGQGYGQYPQMSNTYTDAIAPVYSSTDSPYYLAAQQPSAGQPQQQVASAGQDQNSANMSELTPQQTAQQMVSSIQQQSNPNSQQVMQMQNYQPQNQQQQQMQNNYPTSTSMMPDNISLDGSSDKRQQQPVVGKPIAA